MVLSLKITARSVLRCHIDLFKPIDLEKHSEALVDWEGLDFLWLYLHTSSGNRPYRRQIYTLHYILPPIPPSILNVNAFTWERRSSSKA